MNLGSFGASVSWLAKLLSLLYVVLMLFLTTIFVAFASLIRLFDTPLSCGLCPCGQCHANDTRDDRRNGYVLKISPMAPN